MGNFVGDDLGPSADAGREADLAAEIGASGGCEVERSFLSGLMLTAERMG